MIDNKAISMFKEPKLNFDDLWKVYFDSTLYAVLTPIGCALDESIVPEEDK